MIINEGKEKRMTEEDDSGQLPKFTITGLLYRLCEWVDRGK